MPRSLTLCFLWNRCRGKRSRHPRGMCDTQFCVSGKRPMVVKSCTTSSWRRHSMETFSALLALCEGIQQSPVDSPHKGLAKRALMLALKKRWNKQSSAGVLRRHGGHCDVTVLCSYFTVLYATLCYIAKTCIVSWGNGLWRIQTYRIFLYIYMQKIFPNAFQMTTGGQQWLGPWLDAE